uniref:Ribonuclease H-like domain-containing protein n=1 Tax=Tanacetum cinerariifolium TaxID=118510 RepID=A0A6L2LE97_TANCI|nr:ribonuclease H-like domain-containing protein [Tanacetum cinerariifolium]
MSAAKLPILNPNEFDLWKKRIEQYFLMTDYSLWKVILNGDSLVPTRVIEGLVQPVAPTTAKQRLARKNELKAYGTLVMDVPDKHQLKFNIHKDAKTLMEAIEKRFGGNKETKKVQKTLMKQQFENFTGSRSESLDQIHDRLQKIICQLEILRESLSQEDINLNTNELISVAASVSAVSVKTHVFAFPNIDADDLEEMDLKWQMAMLTVRARQFIQRIKRNLRENVPTSMGFDMSRVECYNYHKKGHFTRECSYDWSFQVDEEPTNYALIAFTSLSSSSSSSSHNESDESLPPSPIYDRYQSGDGYHDVPPPYTGTFMSPKPDLVFHNAPNDAETVHTTFNIELSPTKPEKDLSPIPRPLAPIIEDWVSDSEDESETKIPQNVPSFVQPTKQIKSPRPSVKHKMAQTPTRNPAPREYHKQYARIPLPNPQRHVVSTAVLTQSKLVPITAVRPVSAVVPKPTVSRPRQEKPIVTKPNSPPRRHINRSPSPKASNFLPKVTAAKATMVNVVKWGKWEWKPKCLILDHVSCNTSASMTLKRFDYNDALERSKSDKGFIDSGCSRHMTGNMPYLSDFEELNGGYVAFGGNPKGGKISVKGKIRTEKLDFNDVYFVKELKFNLFSVSHMCDKKNSVLFTDTKCLVLSPEFKLPDENQVLLRVPRENNMYNFDLRNIVPSGNLTCLFAKETLDESNLWHRRLGHINYKTMNKLVKGNLVRGLPSKVFEKDHTYVACNKGKQHRASCKTKPNTDGDAAFDEKEPELEGKKLKYEVNVSPSSSAQSKKHNDKTKREAEGKSPVESLTIYRNLSAEFEDFSDNSINEDNVVGTLVPSVGQISTNTTNTFSAAGPSNAAVSPTHGKSSYVDSSQLPDDLNMPKLEDITYFDDEDDVGTEADFNNLETTITVSPIPTTRVHKDHHVTQIIGDLSSATQTRRFKDPDYPDKVYKVVKALYGLHQGLRAWLKQGESINVQDLETNLYWEFGKFTSRDEWQRFVTLVKQSQELKSVSYHKLYDILKQHQNEVNEIRGKAIVNSPPPIYDQEPSMVAEDDEMSKEKEIDKRMALSSLSFKKIYKPTNNNLQTSLNTSRANQDNSPRINRGTGYESQRIGHVTGARETVGTTVVQKSRIQCYNCKEFRHIARECQKPKMVKDATYHREKMLLCKQEEAGIQLNAEQADWRDDTDDESEDQELEAHYMYMAQIQEITPDAADDSGPIFDFEPLQKVSNDDHYNVFAIESDYHEQSKYVHDTYLIEQDEHNVINDSLDMSYDSEQIDQDDDDDLANERELFASLIEKLKCEIDDSKNHNKFLETSNKVLVYKLKGEIEDFKTKHKSLESSNNRFKEANNKLSETNELMYNDLKKFQGELDRRNDVKYASKMEIDCAKDKGDLISYKMESQKSFNTYTQKINDLNQTISEMKNELSAHQETISILSQAKEA